MPETISPAIDARGLTKRYGAVLANDRVDLTLARGEIHGLLGENGAGKSTVVHTIAGLVAPEEGIVRIHGETLAPGSPEAALASGVGLVAQHFSLVPDLTVWENIVLGREPGRWGFIDRRQARRRARDLIDQLGVDISTDVTVGRLPIGNRQIVEIAKALDRQTSVLILDEPTSTLSPIESERLFDLIDRLRDGGTTILLVTHRITDILEHANRATVLREGRVVHRAEQETWSQSELVRAIVGDRSVTTAAGPPSPTAGRTRLRAHSLTTRLREGQNLHEVTLDVRRGETVGLAGVAGNGQETLLRVLVGLVPVEDGQILLEDADITHTSASTRREMGFAYIPEDRHDEGTVDSFSIADNLLLGDHRRFGTATRIDSEAARSHADRLVETFNIRGPDPSEPIVALSGGNQQKVIVARALSPEPSLVLAAQPTRGLDLAAAYEIRERLARTKENGGSVIVTSADLDELFDLCDRIIVLYAGRIAGRLDRVDYDRNRIGRLMTLGGEDT